MHSSEGFGYSIKYSEHFILVSSFRFRSIVIATTLKITSQSADRLNTCTLTKGVLMGAGA